MLDDSIVEPVLSAPSLAGVAILLEIGAEYKVIDLLREHVEITVKQAAKECGLSEKVIS
jgi:hypothetical protein